ncbi:MAG: type I 3-dehydroquinate dehydratase [Blautia faecis]
MTKPIKIKNLTIGVGIPKICVPLTGITKEQICKEAEAAKKAGADLVEWRADFFEGLLNKQACDQVLEELAQILGERPLLFTTVPKKKGEIPLFP